MSFPDWLRANHPEQQRNPPPEVRAEYLAQIASSPHGLLWPEPGSRVGSLRRLRQRLAEVGQRLQAFRQEAHGLAVRAEDYAARPSRKARRTGTWAYEAVMELDESLHHTIEAIRDFLDDNSQGRLNAVMDGLLMNSHGDRVIAVTRLYDAVGQYVASVLSDIAEEARGAGLAVEIN